MQFAYSHFYLSSVFLSDSEIFVKLITAIRILRYRLKTSRILFNSF